MDGFLFDGRLNRVILPSRHDPVERVSCTAGSDRLTYAHLLTSVSRDGMKKNIHPEYRQVVFQDISADYSFLTRSTVKTDETIQWKDGNEYPLVKVEISSASHPFYTGKQRVLSSGGRVDQFRRRYGGMAKGSKG